MAVLDEPLRDRWCARPLMQLIFGRQAPVPYTCARSGYLPKIWRGTRALAHSQAGYTVVGNLDVDCRTGERATTCLQQAVVV